MRGAAAEVHGRELTPGTVRTVAVVEVERSALVLGSTQSEADVDRDIAGALGVEVVRRRSGGGAVLLDPTETVWIDVEIGRDDPLWADDVSRSMLWLGRVWSDALEAAGVGDALVHDAAMVRSSLATVVCFAGLAPGEVTIDGAKVVGISQRRTRVGARFQCAVPRRWDADRYAALLAPGLARRGVDGGLGSFVVHAVDRSVDAIVDAFVDALP